MRLEAKEVIAGAVVVVVVVGSRALRLVLLGAVEQHLATGAPAPSRLAFAVVGEGHVVIAARAEVVIGTGGARTVLLIAKRLALVAPFPARLRLVFGGFLEEVLVGAAALVVVVPALRAVGGVRLRAVAHVVALVAPLPARLRLGLHRLGRLGE